MKKKNLIIYHRVDLDGVASAALLVNDFVAAEVECILSGWTYGDPIPEVPEEVGKVWIVDVCFGDKHIEFTKACTARGIDVAWFDHHKTSEAYVPEFRKSSCEGKGYTTTVVNTDEKVAACELVHSWIGYYGRTYIEDHNKSRDLIELLSAYDTWDKERFDWTDVMGVQYGLRPKVGLSVFVMAEILRTIDGRLMSDEGSDLEKIRDEGAAILSYLAIKNKGECENYSFPGLVSINDGEEHDEDKYFNAIFMNTLEFNSTTFKNAPNVEEYDILVPFAVMPNGLVRFSVYKNEANDIDVDCSEIAKHFGGGGHKGAAGFQIHAGSYEFSTFLKTKNLSMFDSTKMGV